MRPAAQVFYLAVYALLSTAHGDTLNASKSRASGPDVCALEPGATVSDTCASFSTLDSLNAKIQPSIRSVTHDTDFFSYYRLNLYNKKCPFWSDESSMCGNRACAVETIDNEEDIPLIWRAEELGKLEGPKAQHPPRRQQQESRPLMGELGEEVGESCVVEYDDECDERDYCVPEDESATAKGDYVSLVDNPERFTGYSGPGARQVWEAIYRENCFSRASGSSEKASSSSAPFALGKRQAQAALDLRSVFKEHGRQQALAQGSTDLGDDLELEDECIEKRVFYRVISGMHASISTHLCWDYLNQTTGTWGPNLSCYQTRLHEHPERISNLYFNYALVSRAVAKLRDHLKNYTYCSGDPTQDRLTKQKVLALADTIATGPSIFDESVMFLTPDTASLKEDFRSRFRNVSRIMDCVGCDKCRLWGKLQTAGYGTALKVLFEFDEPNESENPPLRRTELVALVNTLDKISHSLSAVKRSQEMLEARDEGMTLVEHKDVVREMQEGGMPPALPVEAIDDDGFEAESPRKRKKADEETLGDIFREEFGRVFRALMWVFRSWFEFPGKAFTIVVLELSRMWDWYMGFPVRPRSWEFKLPSRDEI